MEYKGNNNPKPHKFRNTIIALVMTITMTIILLAVNVYAATTGINTVLNESAIVRLSGAMAMGKDSNRLVTRDSVESVLSGYNLGSSVVTVTDDITNDYIVVTYSATSNEYLIDKNTIYTITYDANGGTGAPAAQEHRHNDTTTLTTDEPTRSNYRFRGWSTNASATTATYQAGGTYSTNSDVTLYAVWQAEYTITYNANGGSGAPASQIKYHGEPLTLQTGTPTRSNYRFRGWSTSDSATTATYQPGGSFTTDANTTLYAVWQAVYTITYDAHGGTGAPLAQTKYHGEPINLSTTVPTRTNYRFLGWDTNNSATTATYQPNATYTAEGNATLYAIWQAIYTISFDANGGTGAPAAQTKYHGEPITLPATVPTRTNYTFLGWGVSSSATSASYQPGATYTSNGNATLYALWAGNEYTITYNANGGSGAPEAQTYVYAPSGTINLSSTEPTRTGYTFLGWSQSSTATSASYSAGQAWNRSNASNYTLYAVWSVNTYTITYNANGGSGAPEAKTYTYASSGTFNLSSTVPTRTGHTFQGWGTGGASDTTVDYAAGAAFSYATASNTTLYAIWTANEYTITYNANGGSNAPSATTYTYATSGTVNLSTSTPTWDGHTFNGWGTSASDTSVDYAAGASFSKATASNTTLYAIWTTHTYTVSYNANGGSGAPSAQTKTYGVNLTLSSTKPTRTNYTFQGWGTSASDTTVDYAAGATYTANSAITLYAIWKLNTVTITFNANGGSGGPGTQNVTVGVATTLSSTKPTRTNYTFAGWGTSASATSVSYSPGGSITISANTTLYAVWAKTTTTYAYTGGIQSFTVPVTGKYKLEVYGAQGGNVYGNGAAFAGYSRYGTAYGGKGGYAYGQVTLTAGTVLYIGVGGQGTQATCSTDSPVLSTAGYNGGGSTGNSEGQGAAGGGATHIAKGTNRGVLSAYSSYKSEILIVAGGGGGASTQFLGWSENEDTCGKSFWNAGGSGGGTSGGNGGYEVGFENYAGLIGKGGSQSAGGSSGGSFGQGGTTTLYYEGGAGGRRILWWRLWR